MNFFARQAAARTRTRRLVLLFLLALLAVTAAIDLVVLTLLASAEVNALAMPSADWIASRPGTLVVTSLCVLAVIGLSSLYKSASLRAGGGGAVARTLGGARVDRTSTDPLKRRLYNVVEEMSIASGVPVPEIYVLEQETGINAFAAGHTPANAAVAVTRGALEKLNRAELQGVIAHEFSHVLNGDMRINTRLVGLLFGLLVIALIGRTVLRHSPRSSGRRKGGGGAIVLAALAVMLLGYVGVFFGRLIQAAVSRQREALADASAVQFTREPQGLRGALVKIGAWAQGSKLEAPQTDEVAHMLFASGMARLFATHPPLIERIRTLDPQFREEEFAKVRAQLAREAAAEAQEVREGAPAEAGAARRDFVTLAAADIANRVGAPDTSDLLAARAIARSLPQRLLDNLDVPGRALGVLLALLLDSKADARARQSALIAERLGAAALEAVHEVEADVAALAPEQRLPVLGEVLPVLRRLSREERYRILEILDPLIRSDGRIEVFEYALATLTRQYLQEDLEPSRAATSGRLRLDQAADALQIVFSTLARHGADSEVAARQAYEIGMHHLLPQHRPPYAPVADWPAALGGALATLDRLVPFAKEALVQALAKTIFHDRRVTVEESELLRAICASVHCPLPPLAGAGSAEAPR